MGQGDGQWHRERESEMFDEPHSINYQVYGRHYLHAWEGAIGKARSADGLRAFVLTQG
jgi:hypothetical protein